ncbi:MAG TPA: PspC domain-containing protein [Gaiellaceae bacterium]
MTEHIAYKKLRRARSKRMVAGVCEGLGEYFEVNPALYRVGFALLTLLGGAGIFIYIAAALVIPEEGSDDSIVSDALRGYRDRPWALVGVGALAVAAILGLSRARAWPHGNFAWILLVLAGVALIGATGHLTRHKPALAEGREPAPTPAPPAAAPRRRFPLGSIVLGLLVIAAGVIGALATHGVHVSIALTLAGAAVAVGAALIAAALLRLRVGGLAVIALLLAASAAVASTINVHLEDGIGKRTYSPATAASLHDRYRLGIGRLALDLSRLELVKARTTISVRVGIGRANIELPPGVPVHVVSTVNWGESQVLGNDQNGHAVEQTVDRPGSAATHTLVIDVHVGAGNVEIDRAGTR